MKPAIVVHGGAGGVEPAREAACRAGCRLAVQAGRQVLVSGGSARAAVVAAVCALEDDPEFNAGMGACLTRDGTVELDAAVMEGPTLRAGAVGAVVGVKNAVRLAEAVLEDGEHVLLVGEGARAFALEKGIEQCPPESLITPRARERLAKELAKRGTLLDRGTVGAVAIDAAGNLAAATSTGGVTAKRSGRVGDTPLVGAGTYADDAGAASATGQGEPIIRMLLCRTAVDLVRAGLPAAYAARAALEALRAKTGGLAGILVVDRAGRVGHACTTANMPWALSTGDVEEDGV